MTKSEARAVTRMAGFIQSGADAQMIAASLSALIRSAMTKRSADELRALAAAWGIASHPAYIV